MKKNSIPQFRKKTLYKEPIELLLSLREKNKQSFLFESKGNTDQGKEKSLLGIDPVLHLSGKDAKFSIEGLNERAVQYLEALAREKALALLCSNLHVQKNKILGSIKKEQGIFEESKRSQRRNIAQVIPLILKKFEQEEPGYLGLYGAMTYDFVRLFEDLKSIQEPTDLNDFEFYLYDTFIEINIPKKSADIIVFRSTESAAKKAQKEIEKKLFKKVKIKSYKIEKPEFKYSEKEYKNLVKKAQQCAKRGDIFEVVLSNFLTAEFKGDPLALYLKYRQVNPSPYLFFFDRGEEQLVGASPEMMVHVQERKIRMRPISGTAKRGADPIEDHENMLALLNSRKERAELDMLIDLGRNDLSRICKPGVNVKDYRFIEKYSKVMHTVAEIHGELREDLTPFDALVATLNAGTLTGTPKVAAMNLIEEYEKERRGYYGGTIGYLSFSGEINTAIIIRTAHIRKNKLRFQTGATLLYKSSPEKEYQETMHKAEAFLSTFQKKL